MKYLLLFVLLLTSSLYSMAGEGFRIKGKVTGIANGYVEVFPKFKDTTIGPMPEKVRIVNGEFIYAGTIGHPDLVELKISTKRMIMLLENAEYNVLCSFDSLSSDNIKGGKMHAQYMVFRKGAKAPLEYLETHVGEELCSWLAFRFSESLQDAEKVNNLLTPADKASPNGQLFLQKLEAFRKVVPGVPFPALKLTDAKGKPFNMQDMAGKVVVLDFWASWCAPCIGFIPKLREHYKSFTGKDVVFVSVSVDEDTVKWHHAMEEQGMEWTQVLAEGGFRKGEGVQALLNIYYIPYLIVLDKKGDIAALLDASKKETMGEVVTKLLQ
jgi:thiol-disulfide isomerase/thioredoxin